MAWTVLPLFLEIFIPLAANAQEPGRAQEGTAPGSQNSSPALSAAATPKYRPAAPGPRLLHFPSDRSLGMLSYRNPDNPFPGGQLDWTGSGWEFLATARGDVAVPEGVLVILFVSREGRRDLSPLARLGPNDLDSVILWQETRDPKNWSYDRVMPHLAHLSGLQCLIVCQRLYTRNDIECLQGLKSLLRLELNGKEFPEGGLALLRGLDSLQAFSCSTRILEAEFDGMAEMPNVEELTLSFFEIHGEAWQNLRRFPKLTHLRLWADSYRPHSFSALAEFPSVKRLYIGGEKALSNSELREIGQLTQLEELDLPTVHNTDDAWTSLVPLQSLRELNAKNARVTDEGLAHLKKIRSLETLVLNGDSLTDEGLRHISELPNLKGLRTYGRFDHPFTDAGLAHLAKVESLEELIIAGAGIGDAGIESLSKLPRLRGLWIHAPGLTDAGLAKLKSVKTLETITIDGPGLREGGEGFTLEGVSKFSGLLNLRELSIRDVRASSDTLELSDLPRLEKLFVGFVKGGSPRDSDLTCLARLPQLREFGYHPLEGVTDAGLVHLKRRSGLTSLSVGGEGITDRGLECIGKSNPLNRLMLRGSFTDAGIKSLEHRESLRSLSVQSSLPLSDEAVRQLRATIPNLYSFNVRGSQVLDPKNSKVPKVGDLAPQFSTKLLDGTPFHLRDERGNVVVLYFWATWCSPCVKSYPSLKSEYERVKKVYPKLTMVGLSLDDDERALRAYVEDKKPPWAQAQLGSTSRIAADYGVTSVPAFFLIDPRGRIRQNPASEGGPLEQEVAKALGEKSTN